jgi:PBSX family phage terminase large subunit
MTDTVIRFEVRGAARTFLAAHDREVLLSGPAGSGKTVVALMKLHLAALQHPGLRGLIIRQTQTSLTSTTLNTFRELVAKEAIVAGIVRWYGGSASRPAAYRYSNGSELTVGGLDRGPDKFLSAEVDRIFIDEAVQISETSLETLITRLRGKADTYKQVTLATNPSSPSSWLFQRAARGATRMLYSTHKDNPYLTHPDGTLTPAGMDYMAKLDGLSGVRRKRLLDGIWCTAEGIIYESYDPAIHVVDRFPIPEGWPAWVSVDFGFNHPFVAQVWREDGDGRLFLVGEIFKTGVLVEDHARQLKSMLAQMKIRPRAVICDHDAEDRATLEKHLGMGTSPAKKTVSDGIQAVQSRLRVQPDGKPRLFIMRDAVVKRDPALVDASRPASTEEEFPSYVWAVRPGGNLKEEPLKEMDDGMDALRYMVAERDLGARPRYRSFSR